MCADNMPGKISPLEAKVWTNALKLIKFTCTFIFDKLRQESRNCLYKHQPTFPVRKGKTNFKSKHETVRRTK